MEFRRDVKSLGRIQIEKAKIRKSSALYTTIGRTKSKCWVELMVVKTEIYFATRKTANAHVHITKGVGKVRVNNVPIDMIEPDGCTRSDFDSA